MIDHNNKIIMIDIMIDDCMIIIVIVSNGLIITIIMANDNN